MSTLSMRLSTLSIALMASGLTAAEDTLNAANTSWILTSTALVLFMTLPGLALFYGGLVRSKNVLSILMQCFAITCIASVLWFVPSAKGTLILGGWEKPCCRE